MGKSIEEWRDDVLVHKIMRVTHDALIRWCILNDDINTRITSEVILEWTAKAFHDMKAPTAKELASYIPTQWNALSFSDRMQYHIISSMLRAFLEG